MSSGEFLGLVPSREIHQDRSVDFLSEAMKAGRPIARPWLEVGWDKDLKAWRVMEHEGRGRATVAGALFPGENVQVDIVYNRLRNKDVTDAMRAADILPQKSSISNATVTSVLIDSSPEAGKFARLEDVPPDVARAALQKRLAEQAGKPIVPPYDGELPTEARVLWEGLEEFTNDVRGWQKSISDEWGQTVKTTPQQVTDKLNAFKKAYQPRIDELRLKAGVIAEGTRNFVLHDYNKTYLDHALTYITGNSLHYWTTRTYARALETFIDQPRFATAYLAYKEYMSRIHGDLSPWWRQNIQLHLPGLDPNSEYFMNLESSINPIYGITGVDFNDPKKRVDAVSRLMDDMNKQGPSFSPHIQWAVAMYLYNKGEAEAGERWAGRLLPQSAMIKSLTAKADDILGKFGWDVDTKPVEIDPFTNFLGEGFDPYERNKVIAALIAMENEKQISPEETFDAFTARSGPIWDAAAERAADERFGSDAMSFIGGPGYKVRTQNDLVIDQFWTRQSALMNARSLMSPEDYRAAWDKLRVEFPFMDGLLIGRKSGKSRDTALAYSVLGRIPPGQLNDVAELVGIKDYMTESFFDNKGDLTKMLPQDRDRFLSGIADLMVMMAVPSGATKEEWTLAKDTYLEMNKMLERQFGEDIQLKISAFYDLEESERDAWLGKNKEVGLALDQREALIANTPILSAYYGGLDNVSRYHINAVYATLDEKYGADMKYVLEAYDYLKLSDPASAKVFRKTHNLDAYFDERGVLLDAANRAIVSSASQIPAGQFYQIRPEFLAQSGIQEDVLRMATADPNAQANMIWGEMSGALQSLVLDYLNGEELTSEAGRQLERIGDKYGLSQYEVLNMLGASIPR